MTTEAQARKKVEAEVKKVLKGDEYELGAIKRFQNYCKDEKHWAVEVMAMMINGHVYTRHMDRMIQKGSSKK